MTTLLHRARALVAVFTLLASAAIAVGPAAHRAAATPAVYNGKIAFHEGDGIFTVNADGSHRAHIVDGSYPTWSPDGSRLGVWATYGQYVSVAPDGSDVQTVASEVGAFPRWSPDKTKVLYQRFSEGDSVFVRNVEEATDIDLLPGLRPNLFPVWSPDGTRIAFQSNSSGHAEVWIMNADGSSAHVVPNLPEGNSGTPSFSPDGTKLVFINDPTGGDAVGEIYVIGVDGNGLTQVGPTDRYNTWPSFSPDGTRIVYGSAGAGYTQDAATGIHVVNADGTGAHQITSGNDMFPAWQPLSSPPENLPPRSIGTAKEKFPLWLFGNAEASFDGDGTIVSYEWRWGDNTAMTPHRYAWHHYSKPGTYLIRLTVTDNDGAKTTRKAWVTVTS